MSTIVKSTLRAWLPEWSSLSPEDLHTEAAIDEMVFSTTDMRSSGWTLVGEADIAVTMILTPDELIASKVATLKVQAEKIRADAHREVMHIEDKINRLLAITYKEAA